MKSVSIFIPVAPFEPLSIIEKSIQSLRQLEKTGLTLNITYLLDGADVPDQRARYLENNYTDVDYIIRTNSRGRRAGAINDGLKTIRKPDGTLNYDFIALFDVDSRPDPDFLLNCINMLENDADAVIASGARYITNQDSGWVPKIIAAEYSFFEFVYLLYERFNGFKQFNGLIGVIDAHIFDDMKLNEYVHCEDLDFTQRIYIKGKKSVLADTRVGEQAPTTLKELFSQRIRWLSGALEGLSNNIARFPGAPVPANLKIAWFMSMTLPFAAFLLIPFVPAYGLSLKSKGHDHVLYKTLGLIFHLWLITLCGKIAIFNRIRKKKIVWTDSSRSNI
jgi:1,2-diacylglycerol 3-beta-glucosyltransferase